MTKPTFPKEAPPSNAWIPPLLPRFWPALAAAAATGILIPLSFPKWNLDVLIWIALVPLFAAARGAGWKRGLLLGWVAGMTLESLGFSWILDAILSFTGFNGMLAPVAWLCFGAWLLYASLPWAALGWLLGRSRSPSWIHAVIPFWVGIEGYFPRLFPWHVGGAVYDRDWPRQCADLLGASGLTYVVLVINTLPVFLLEWKRGRRPFPRWTLLAAAILAAGVGGYGAWRFRTLSASHAASPGLRIGILQPFLRPEVKHLQKDRTASFFFKLIQDSQTLAAGEPLDLILWPEGMDPFAFVNEPGVDPLIRHRTQDGRMAFDGIPVPLVLGGGAVDSGRRVWGSAAYILPAPADGGGQERPRAELYLKNIRLLFGERMPFEDYLPQWVKDRISVGTLEAGTEQPLFHLSPSAAGAGGAADRRFRILICYEAVLPDYYRQNAEGVDFLVNLTEDIWYGRTSHIGQHESVLRLRAVENRTPLARCTNVGPSGVIDALGRFNERTAVFEPDSKVVTLRPGTYPSFYKMGGRWFPLATLIVGAALFVKLSLKNS